MSGDERPAELRILDRYVGTWLNDKIMFPTKAYPVPTRDMVVEQTDLELDAFVLARMVNANTGLKSLWLITPDEVDRTNSTFWYFDNSGYIDLWDCRWNTQGEMMI